MKLEINLNHHFWGLTFQGGMFNFVLFDYIGNQIVIQ